MIAVNNATMVQNLIDVGMGSQNNKVRAQARDSIMRDNILAGTLLQDDRLETTLLSEDALFEGNFIRGDDLKRLRIKAAGEYYNNTVKDNVVMGEHDRDIRCALLISSPTYSTLASDAQSALPHAFRILRKYSRMGNISESC